MKRREQDSLGSGPVAIHLPSLGRNGLGGGAERVAVTLAREFVEAGYQVDLVLSVTHPSSNSEVDSRVRIVDLRCRRLWTSLPRLVAYRWRERPSVILSLMPLANSLNVLSAWLGPRRSRAVLSEHNSQSIALAAGFAAEGTKWLHPLCRLTYPHAAAIIGCSEGVADRVRDTYPRSAKRITGIPNPVISRAVQDGGPPHPWLADSETPCIVALGRLHEQKDPLTLLRTVAIIQQNRGVRLLVLGEGDLRQEVEGEIQRLGLTDVVELLGHKSDPRRYLRHADLFLHTAKWEGLPVVLLEALAEGVPVVSTDCESGPSEILAGGRFGRLAPVGDAEALAAAVLDTLNEVPDREALRARAREFEPGAISRRYLRVLESAVKVSAVDMEGDER